VVGGRAIDRRDGERAPRVVVVNRQLARRFFAGEDPVGRFVLVRGESSPRQVIGVVGDERSAAPDPRPQPVLYVPHAQDAIPVMNLLVRTAGVPGAELAREAELALWSVSRSINVYQVETLAERLDDLHWRWRFAAQLLSAFAALALVLGAVGLYSVVSYAVRSRRRELAVRLAFGAGSHDVVRLVVGTALWPTLAGVLLGLGSSLLLGRVLGSLLYETQTADPLTWVAVALVLVATASAAAVVPAARALRLDPIRTLREE
jgi:hypothetical protein